MNYFSYWPFYDQIGKERTGHVRSGLEQQSSLRYDISYFCNIQSKGWLVVSQKSSNINTVFYRNLAWYTLFDSPGCSPCSVGSPKCRHQLSASWWVQQIIVTLIALIGWHRSGVSLVGRNIFLVLRTHNNTETHTTTTSVYCQYNIHILYNT